MLLQLASLLRELTCHMGSLAEVTFPPLPQPKLVPDTQFSDLRGMQGSADLRIAEKVHSPCPRL